ncbi:MAG: asparagine synthase-related protein [Gemmatimonadaceae bacterium]
MHRLGAERIDIWRDAGVMLAVARHEWEAHRCFGGPTAIAVTDRIAVVADASLYYRADLQRALRSCGVRPTGDSTSELILAAYDAWGDRCCTRVEGDFAFILWDRIARRVLCARDFVGLRSLHYATLGRTFLAATTIGGVIASPRCPVELDWVTIGNAVARLFAASHRSCYRDVRRLLGGQSLDWQPGAGTRVWRHWDPPATASGGALPLDEAALELRRLLLHSVNERMPSNASASVWMSGGYDSTAIYGAGQGVLRRSAEGRRLGAVSMSYPEGDVGREDDAIRLVADFWSQPVRWVRSADVPMFGDDQSRAAARDDVLVHPFELWQRALARASRADGSHIALLGIGGDELFAASDLYLADLFRRGRWRALAREWDARLRRNGWRYLVEQALVPVIPDTLRKAIGLFRGRLLASPDSFRTPSWMRPDFVRDHGLEAVERAFTPRLARATLAVQQAQLFLTHPAFGTLRAPIHTVCAEEGIEVRLPLFDRRIIDLAVPRPMEERVSAGGRESKRLLRQAVSGLLPESVIAPRPSRAGGLTSGYFDLWMRQHPPTWFEEVLRDPLLAQVGVVDAAALRAGWNSYRQSGDTTVGTQLFATFETELWLRARESIARRSRRVEDARSRVV